MFDSLDESIKHDLKTESSTKERIARYAAIGAISLIVIAGLYEVVHLLG